MTRIQPRRPISGIQITSSISRQGLLIFDGSADRIRFDAEPAGNLFSSELDGYRYSGG